LRIGFVPMLRRPPTSGIEGVMLVKGARCSTGWQLTHEPEVFAAQLAEALSASRGTRPA
jgi:hypothetical protein